ncbi:damage-inducible protein DinB [Pseudomonas palleroniana]|uniref:Damage-inducible protein DinB n=1 Tax=Pseudomonas palleroniana TaxID=191390 RepID=A0A0X7K8D3_9PSED|nr:DinB family protein [Pseudomonas palleroniana]AVE04010.1 damage-inducible protein DinB [Pseudomonas palleroniana]KWU51955.1 diguanylate cyclase [Pseudomonas palleroniana]MBI6908188.1 DinB family protein [Pseudomonas palleroniana]
MNRIEHVALMASYNQWMNQKVYAAAGQLPDAALSADRQAFFGSILGTLNHLALGDTVWLKRFAQHPAGFAALAPLSSIATPTDLKQLAFADIRELSVRRAWLDQLIIDWVNTLREPDLDHRLQYSNMRGVGASKPFFGLLVHFFNHQTHHRGQATTLLSQAGVDVGVTDLLALID